MPSEIIRRHLERVLFQGRSTECQKLDLDQLVVVLKDVSAQDYTFVRDSDYASPVLGLAAPAFDFQDKNFMAVSTVDVGGRPELEPQSLALAQLKQAISVLPKRLA